MRHRFEHRFITVKGSTKKKLKIMLRFLELYVCKSLL